MTYLYVNILSSVSEAVRTETFSHLLLELDADGVGLFEENCVAPQQVPQ